jgi:SAM-dependent methyltransferase
MNKHNHTTTEWFASWFDSPYYHMLYRNRNEQEANDFIHTLMAHINLPTSNHVLDLACGKGRHSRTLAALGYQVTGMDLSSESIAHAQSLSPSNNPAFKVHDMRQPFGTSQYALVLNLFTSFGYFNNPEENNLVLCNIFDALTSGGRLVIDFLNPGYVTENLVPAEQDEFNHVTFSITRCIEDGFVRKHIRVTDAVNGVDASFMEQVQLFEREELTNMLRLAGFQVNEVFGNYQLGQWEQQSPRTIIIAKKP